ncbi:spore cortex biosynthesis protein YabQ [Paenibacillus thermotolerans]|uniref:spore cortex biosynthesis protein YabQ n=1 Tax=Paenibacillus thermotolerans TaxID=3027807 RepID=UPI002367C26F|nr:MULTISPECIES: spore cortex biosynthesis protein YabQ [unclassified Paenibacillus]
MTLDTQLLTLAAMALSGAGLGLLFDTYRVVSGEFRFPRWLIPPLDLLYWFAGTLAVFRILYESNGGEVRMYVFLALLIGVSFYFGLLSGLVVRLIRTIIRFCLKTVRFALWLGNIMFIKPIMWLYRASIVILGFLAALSIFLSKLMLQLAYPFWRFLTWVGKPLFSALGRLVRAERWLVPIGRTIAAWIAKVKSWF